MNRPSPDNRQRKSHGKLYISVAIAMAVIVGAWAVLLPEQLRVISSRGMGDTDRWGALQEETTTSLEDALAELRAGLDRLESEAEQEKVVEATAQAEKPRATLPILEDKSGVEKQVDLLRARLEASSQNE